MSLTKKILLLFLCFIALNVYTISTFNYEKVQSNNNLSDTFDVAKISEYFTSIKLKALELKQSLTSEKEQENTQVIEVVKEPIKPVKEPEQVIVVKEKLEENLQIEKTSKIDENKEALNNKIQEERKTHELSENTTKEQTPQLIVKKEEKPSSNIVQTPKEIQSSIDEILVKNKITFKRRSTKITKDSYLAVEKISKILKKHKDLNIEIAGHTDSRGKASLNKRISQKRANSVRQVFIKLGVSKKRLKAVGYGEAFPIAKDDKNGLSEINRRVEINIVGVKK